VGTIAFPLARNPNIRSCDTEGSTIRNVALIAELTLRQCNTPIRLGGRVIGDKLV